MVYISITIQFGIPNIAWICRANQWTGFYMITASALKGLKHKIEFLLYLELKLFNHDIKYSQK